MTLALAFRDATTDDAADLAVLVRRAYRGEESRTGWTTEADLLTDERIDEPTMLGKITAPGSVVLIATDVDGQLTACCEVVDRGDGLAYFGMFAVLPARQAGGLGRQVLAHAERVAAGRLGATKLEMTVIDVRTELIAWYERRGYAVTGEQRPFPYGQLINGTATRDDLMFTVLAKDLDRG